MDGHDELGSASSRLPLSWSGELTLPSPELVCAGQSGLLALLDFGVVLLDWSGSSLGVDLRANEG